MLAGASPSQQRALAEYGKHLGTAFQLIDDVLDYQSDPAERGKNLGDDLAEGKPTLPLIHVMATGTPAERDLVREAITNGHTEHFEAIMTAIGRTGALDYARARARDVSGRARAQLSN